MVKELYLVLLELRTKRSVPPPTGVYSMSSLCDVCARELEEGAPHRPSSSVPQLQASADPRKQAFCQTCRKFVYIREFGLKKNGSPLKTCKHCSDRKMRYYHTQKMVRKPMQSMGKPQSPARASSRHQREG